MDYGYSYNLSSFPNGKCDISRLNQEVHDSDIVIALDYINEASNQVTLFFKAELTDDQELTLSQIIANHSGDPLPENIVQNVKVVVEQPKYVESGNVTQELFCAESIIIDVSAQIGTSYHDVSWPFNIGLKSGTIYVSDSMVGDEMSVKIAPNTIIGVITSNLNIGDSSIYVSPTVIQNVKYGQYIGLPQQNKELGRVISLGSDHLTFTPASDTSANAGSYIGMCAKIIPYTYFNTIGKIEIGKTLTTANRIPANTKIRIEYTNNNGTAKKVSFFIEYLY